MAEGDCHAIASLLWGNGVLRQTVPRVSTCGGEVSTQAMNSCPQRGARIGQALGRLGQPRLRGSRRRCAGSWEGRTEQCAAAREDQQATGGLLLRKGRAGVVVVVPQAKRLSVLLSSLGLAPHACAVRSIPFSCTVDITANIVRPARPLDCLPSALLGILMS